MHNKIVLFIISFLLLWGLPARAQNIGGIGAMLAIDSSGDSRLPVIRNILPNSPAAGSLKENLYILKVNGVSCKNKTIEEVVGLIRGDVGTHVTLQAAENKEGKHAIDYDLVRAAIQQPAASVDPITAFNKWCENEVKQLRRKEQEIIKTFESDCGNYFFNFNAADMGLYHTRLYTLEDLSGGGNNHSFDAAASVADGNNEAGAKTLAKGSPYRASWGNVAILEGDIQIKRPGVGLISVKIIPIAQDPKCKAMYIAVYR